jgi:cyclopropane fatty-acyl-phospholipid synthase-like methyltransferase
MAFRDDFDAAMCVDALEHLCPEDWPVAFGNFQRAIRSAGCLYFTVEIADEAEVKEAFLRAQDAGLPVIYGEWPDENPYHYYPPMQQVRDWLREAGFDILEEEARDGYHHFLSQKA